MRFFIVLLLLLTLSPVAFSQLHKPIGTYQKNLGNVGDAFLTTTGQCKQILRMMKEKPGKNIYTITYRDVSTIRSFAVDMTAATITRNRIVGKFNNKRKTEIWTGDVMKRLKDGASDNISSLGRDSREETR